MSVHPKPKGKGYVVRWRDLENHNRQRTFDRKGDADEWDTDMKRLRQRGHLPDLNAGTITLSQFVETVFIPTHASRLAPATQRFYAELLDVHLIPKIGTLPLKSITRKRIRAWQTERSQSGAGAYATNRALMLLGAILQRAAEDGELESNPARLVRPLPTDKGRTVRPLAPSLVERLRSRMELRDRTITSVLAYGGLRPAEVYALTLREVLERTILVEWAVDGMGGRKRTKTGQHRSVRKLGPLAEDLDEWVAYRRLSSPDAQLFAPVRSAGTWATKSDMANWRARQWKQAWLAAGYAAGDVQRPYDLRHSFASLLLAEGRTVHYVAAQLGHDARLTLSTYGHVIAEFEDSPRTDPEAAIRKARMEMQDTAERQEREGQR